MIGKGITRFHAIYWPAFLLSAGLKLPKSIFVHGYFTVNGQKMSKTVGNVIDPVQLINKYGADPLRYYFLREIPPTSDGDFSERRFKDLYNADLANGLGNLTARIAKLCEMNNINVKPFVSHFVPTDHLSNYEFSLALEEIWKNIKKLDVEINTDKPWETKDTKKLQKYVEELQQIAVSLQPFLPETSQKILDQFKGPKIKISAPLFPRII